MSLGAAIMVEEVRNIEKAVFSNGLTVLTEKMDHIRSVSMGIWVKSGSRHEDPHVNGISHFVEHMVFKGTSNRTAEDIARQVDSIGGNMDAFTGKETICFNIKVLDEHLPIAVDVLSDMVLHPVFDGKEIIRERGVILEEIKMDEDNPDYLVHEIFTQNFFKDHPLGKPILGTKETVRRFDQPSILSYYGGKFAPGNMIISAAGNLDHHEFVDLLRQRFEQLPPVTNGWHDTPPKTNSRIILRNKKSLEQVQICVGVPSYSISHDRRYVTYVLNTLLGGGMSSRLFQNVREKQGLVYSIFSELNPFRDAGMLSVYAGHFARVGGEGGAGHRQRVPPAEDGADHGRRAQAREGPAEGQPDAESGIEYGAHVEPGTAGDVLRPLHQHGRDHRPHSGGERRRSAAVGERVVPAGIDCGDHPGEPGRAEGDAGFAGVLRAALRGSLFAVRQKGRRASWLSS